MMLALVAVSSVTLTYCSKLNDNVVLYVDGSVMKYTAVIHVYQTGTTNTVPAGLNFKITGKDAGLIYDISGNKTITADDQGYIRIGVDPNYNLSNGSSINFNIETSAAGFIPVALPIKLENYGEAARIELPMLNTQALPGDIAYKTTNVSLVGNVPSAPIVINTAATAATGAQATVIIPSGTQFKDAAGNAITGTNLVATLVETDVQAGSTPNQVPGGGNSQMNIQSTDPSKKSVYFTPASLVNLKVTVDGKTVSTYSNPIIVQASFPKRINPATENLIANGDNLDVFIYEDNTKEWSFGGTVGVSVNNGTTTVTGSYNHNSVFLFNYNCNTTPSADDLKLVISDKNKGIDVNSSDLYIVDFFSVSNANYNSLITDENQAPFFSCYINAHDKDTVTISKFNLPAGQKILAKVYDMDYDHDLLNDTKRWITGTDVKSLYTGTTWNNSLQLPDIFATGSSWGGKVLSLKMSVPKPKVIFQLKGYAVCPSGTTQYRANNGEIMQYKLKVNATTPFNSGNVNYYDQWRVLGAFKNGTFTTKRIEPGQIYAFSAYFGGKNGLKYDIAFPSNVNLNNYPVVNGIIKASMDAIYTMHINGVYCN